MTGRGQTLNELLAAVPSERRREIPALMLEFGAKFLDLAETEKLMMIRLAEEIVTVPGCRSLDQAFGLRVRGGKSPATGQSLRSAISCSEVSTDPRQRGRESG